MTEDINKPTKRINVIFKGGYKDGKIIYFDPAYDVMNTYPIDTVRNEENREARSCYWLTHEGTLGRSTSSVNRELAQQLSADGSDDRLTMSHKYTVIDRREDDAEITLTLEHSFSDD